MWSLMTNEAGVVLSDAMWRDTAADAGREHCYN